jgi:hypothetical protein
LNKEVTLGYIGVILSVQLIMGTGRYGGFMANDLARTRRFWDFFMTATGEAKTSNCKQLASQLLGQISVDVSVLRSASDLASGCSGE